MKLTKQVRKAYLLLAGMLCAFALQAQLWNKTYIEDRPTMLFSSVHYAGNYKLTGVISGYPNNYARGLIANINGDGVLNNYITVIDSVNRRYGVFNNTLIPTLNGQLAFTGYTLDSVQSLLWGIVDTGLQNFTAQTFQTPVTSAFQGYNMLQTLDSCYYITGVRTNEATNNADVVLVKLDGDGNRLWEKYYNGYKIDYARKIIELRTGNLMLGAVRNNLNQTNEQANTWLIEVDTGGNVIRQWFDPNNDTYAAEGLLQTADGGFIYAAQKKSQQTVNAVLKIATIVKLDSSFNKKWIFSGGIMGTETGFVDIEQLSDGSFIACGKRNYRSGWIVKLSNAGNTIWSREYVGIPDTGSENYLTDIDVMEDGSLIAVGQCQFLSHTPPQVGWFLKLDSNGCEIENCTLGLEDIQEEEAILKVYPNPANAELHVEVPFNLLGGTVTIYNVAGQQVLQSFIENTAFAINVLNQPKGVYIIKVQKAAISKLSKIVVE